MTKDKDGQPDMVTVRLAREPKRLGSAQLALFAGARTADVADARGGGGLDGTLRPLVCAVAFAGSAVTVRTPPNDNLAAYVAVEALAPGSVVVIATGPNLATATIGDTIVGLFAEAGAVAVVIDGLIRDRKALERIGLPIFARGLSPNAPRKQGGGEIGLPLAFGGQIVASGDLVVGDADGLVVVPADDVDRVGRVLAARREAEAAQTADERRRRYLALVERARIDRS